MDTDEHGFTKGKWSNAAALAIRFRVRKRAAKIGFLSVSVRVHPWFLLTAGYGWGISPLFRRFGG
jgi:hypothetical protein